MSEPIKVNDEISYETKLKKHKKRTILISSILIAIMIGSAAFCVHLFLNKKYNSYQVISTTIRTDSNTVKYMKSGKNLLKYSRDGASVINGKGQEIWNGTYDMKEPEAVICGEYTAIADIGNETVVIFDEKGNATTIDALLPIQKVRVAEQGVITLLLQDVDGNKIVIYNPYNSVKKVIYDIKTYFNQNGYPIDFDISKDGKKMVTSYLNVKNTSIDNTINFYNFGEVGQNVDNYLMGYFPYGEMIVPKVEFVTNDIVCAYGESQFTLYAMKERPSEIYKEEFKSNIKSIFSDTAHIGFVLENQNGKEKYRVVVYNLKGKKILDKAVDYDYDKVMISGNDIIFNTNLECIILKLDGTEKFQYTFDKNIDYFMPINNFNKYFVIDNANIEEIKLTEAEK